MRSVLPLLLICALVSPSAVWASTPARAVPHIVVNRLELPPALAGTKYDKLLLKILKDEARKADWGASSSSTIEFRFTLLKLTFKRHEDALIVQCEAVGRLPRGRPAHSQLAFGGNPAKQSELVKQVLTIVARGVLTRLAEMERVRRGQQSTAQVRLPETE